MRARIRRSGRDHGRRTRGVAIIEAAIVAPVIFTLILAIFEFGLYFRDSLTLGDAAADAARIGAIVGRDSDSTIVNADFQIMKTIREATASIDVSEIERIVVFQATGNGAANPLQQITASCRRGIQTQRCVVYEDPIAAYEAVQSNRAAYFACTEPCYSVSERNEGPNPANIHYLGVYIRMAHPSLTGIIDDRTIEVANVVRLEPGAVEVSSP